jgi:hypothetical protein
VSETTAATQQVEEIKSEAARLESESVEWGFCTAWPMVEKALSLIEPFAGKYPKVQAAIKALREAGDEICHS